MRVGVGLAPRQADLMKGTASFVAGRREENSIFAVLHRECHVLFPDELFADLFRGYVAAVGATSDRGGGDGPAALVRPVGPRRGERVASSTAAGSTQRGGWTSTTRGLPTRCWSTCGARLARSERPRRIFEGGWGRAREAGLVGAPRVLDSTPLYRRGGHHGHRHFGPFPRSANY